MESAWGDDGIAVIQICGCFGTVTLIHALVEKKTQSALLTKGEHYIKHLPDHTVIFPASLPRRLRTILNKPHHLEQGKLLPRRTVEQRDRFPGQAVPSLSWEVSRATGVKPWAAGADPELARHGTLLDPSPPNVASGPVGPNLNLQFCDLIQPSWNLQWLYCNMSSLVLN